MENSQAIMEIYFYSKEISVQPHISRFVSIEAINRKGKDGIKFIAVERIRMRNYLKVTNHLIGLDQNNFKHLYYADKVDNTVFLVKAGNVRI